MSLHRNGAVDGFVLSDVLPEPTFLIARQLRKGLMGRLFFDGIEVVRDKDEGDRSFNAAALDQAVALLRDGGRLVVFPEGTSTLRHRPLPFKTGAARILERALTAGIPVAVVPLAHHHERAWAFRSRMEIMVGEPVATSLPAHLDLHARVDELHRRMGEALLSVGTSFGSDEEQETAQRLAYAATLGTDRSYALTLKQLERGVPTGVQAAWRDLLPRIAASRAFEHQGIPLVPLGPSGLYALALMLLAPFVLSAALLNLPPVAAAWWAGRTLPDDRNVIALWRLLVGLPALALWTIMVAMTCLLAGHPGLFAGHLLVTWLGLGSWYRFKKLAVTVGNTWRARDLAPRLRALHETLLQELPA